MLDVHEWSYWERSSLIESIDFLVVGAGIVGYSTALSLRKEFPSAKIVIIERGMLPSGASSKNAGFACFGSVTELYDDLSKNDEKTVWDTVALRWKGLQRLRDLLGDEQIGLEINGSWDLITDEELGVYEQAAPMIPVYNEALEAITREKDVYSVDDSVAEKFGFAGVKTSFYNRLEGQINTGKMNLAFYQKVISEGIHVLFSMEARKIGEKDGNVIVQTSLGEIQSKQVAICTNGFAASLLPKQDVLPARAQVLITRPIENLQIKGTFHYQAGYYYFRNIDGRILFGGGRNLDPDGETTTEMTTTEMVMTKLKELLGSVILPTTDFEIDYSWAGIMGVGNTKKPIIKQVSDNVFCGIRLGGMGVAIGTLVGEELATLMAETTNPKF